MTAIACLSAAGGRFKAMLLARPAAAAGIRTALLALAALPSYAAPPVLALASEPLTVSCRVPGSVAADVVRGAALLVAGEVFQASYDMRDWSGGFERYALSANGISRWDAGAILTGGAGQTPHPAAAARNIQSAIVQADGSLAAIPFTWETLSAQQQALLDLAPSAARAKPDGLGSRRLAWLRGERGDEGTLFRRRTSVLGDAVNGTPVQVASATGAGRGADYAAFHARAATRRPMLYLGANDGMLHGFDTRDGSEIYAYVPDALIAALNQLTAPDYVHRAYVDGPAFAGEALVDGGWRSMLLSAMGAGAQGLFALDVTDPERIAPRWEFTDRDDPMMGNVATTPQIARVRVRSGQYRHFAVAASGWNNYADDGHRSAAGNGALFLLALDKPPAEGWKLNTNYYRIATPISEPAQANGLSAPALVADADGVLRYAYAGDLQGNLWRFDFSGSAPWSRVQLFSARDGDGARQPIAQQPRVVYASGGGYLILFGTGRAIEQADLAGKAQQSFYAIHDTLAEPPTTLSRQKLTARLLRETADGLMVSGPAIEYGSMGWYVDFLGEGERSIASATVADGQVLFNTLLPGKDVCGSKSSRSYAMDALTGLASSYAVATGLTSPGPGVTGLLHKDYAAAPLQVGALRSAARRDPTGKVTQQKIVTLTQPGVRTPVTAAASAAIEVTLRSGRLSWREVANWRELHRAAIKGGPP
ncbi:pilus assembly protein [Oxalobacteraceae bacterium A2-2]